MSSNYVAEVKSNAKNTKWETEIDQNLTPKTSDNLKVVPEPYCSGLKGSVIGRCDDLKTNCDDSDYYECQCNGDTGSIEKCSKFILFCYFYAERPVSDRHLSQISEKSFYFSESITAG